MLRIIKVIISIVSVTGIIVGFCMMISEPAMETWTVVDILRINGVGMITFCVSVLILSRLNKDESSETETKGGKYYGIR